MLNQRDREVLDRIVRLVQGGQVDPAAAIANMRELADLAEPLRQRLTTPGLPYDFYTVSFNSPGKVTVANTGITPIPASPIVFSKGGRIVGVKASVREGYNLGTHVVLQIKDQRGYSFFSNGTSDDYVSCSALASADISMAGWFRFLGVEVKRGEQWTVAATSKDALPGAGSTDYTPEVIFMVEPPDR